MILINFVSENLSTITHNSRPGTDGIEICTFPTPFRNSAMVDDLQTTRDEQLKKTQISSANLKI